MVIEYMYQIKIMEILMNDSDIINTPITFKVKSVGQANNAYTLLKSEIEYNNRIPSYNNKKALILRIVQVYGLLTQYRLHLTMQMSLQELGDDKQLKPNHLYSLKVSVTNQSVDISQRRGFGLFYSMNHVIAVLTEGIHAYKKLILTENYYNLSEKELEIVSKVMNDHNLTTTDEFVCKLVDLF